MSQQPRPPQQDDLSLYELLLMLGREWRVFVGVSCALLVLSSIVLIYQFYHRPNQELRVNLISLGGYTQTAGQVDYANIMPSNLIEALNFQDKKNMVSGSDHYVSFLSPSFIEHRVLEEFYDVFMPLDKQGGGIRMMPAEKDFVAIATAKHAHRPGPYRPQATLKFVAASNTPHLRERIQEIVDYVRKEEQPFLDKFLLKSKDKLAFNQRELNSVDKEIKRDNEVLSNYTTVRVHDLTSARIVSTELGFLTNFTHLRKERFSLLAQSDLLTQGLESAEPAKLYLSYREAAKQGRSIWVYLALTVLASLFIALVTTFMTVIIRQQAQVHRQRGGQDV